MSYKISGKPNTVKERRAGVRKSRSWLYLPNVAMDNQSHMQKPKYFYGWVPFPERVGTFVTENSGMIKFIRRDFSPQPQGKALGKNGWILTIMVTAALVACEFAVLQADEIPRLILTLSERVVSLQQTKVPAEIISEYPLPAELLWEYQRAPNPRKSYVRFWASPSGINILRDAPADHLHHHGLMFAVGVDEVDFWAEDAKSGWQKDRGITCTGTLPNGTHLSAENGGRTVRLAWLVHNLTWTSADGVCPLLEEVRRVGWAELGQGRTTQPVRLTIWQSELSLPPGKQSARLWGRPYFGFGIRLAESMDKVGEFLNAEGRTGLEGTNDTPSPWCAYRLKAGDWPITLAIFDHPANPRHPATWFTMLSPFTYMSATLALHREPIELISGAKLHVRYVVALWEEIVPREVLQAFYENEIVSSGGIVQKFVDLVNMQDRSD